jgi:hypothetical protein
LKDLAAASKKPHLKVMNLYWLNLSIGAQQTKARLMMRILSKR